MAIATTTTTTMSSSQDDQNNNNNNKIDDQHEHDLVMPGFRFHPTEEELIEFYLRRKVEGKRFNVELITFLDLYRYDPWELPALAAIGEKEWYFYVPRDRKYRNGDRPNRVTTSGYWKATGADRMIRTENFRSIGLKKTLVFYSGKAPKGIRTSWIMNEYRLPHHETERLQKAEISLCRVHKRAGVEDHPSLPRLLPTRGASSSSRTTTLTYESSTKMKNNIETLTSSSNLPNGTNPIETGLIQPYHVPNPQHLTDEKLSETSGNSSTSTNDHVQTSLALSKHSSNFISLTTLGQDCTSIFPDGPTSFVPLNPVDDLHRLVNYQQYHTNSTILQPPLPLPLPPPPQSGTQLGLNILPGSLQAAFTDRLWDWNAISEASKDYNNAFK